MTHEEHKSYFGGWKLTAVLVALFVVLLAFVIVPPLVTSSSLSDEEIVVGAILPLSGSQSSFGQEYLLGINLAVEELRSSGKNIRVEYADSQGDASLALDAYFALTEKGIQAIIGPVSSSEAKFIAPYAEIFHTVLVTFATSEAMDDYDFYVFQFTSSDKYLSTMLAEYEYLPGEESRVAVVWSQDDFSRTFYLSLKEAADRLNEECDDGETYLEIISIPLTSMDEVAARLVEELPDEVVIVPASPAVLCEFASAVRSQDILNYLYIISTDGGYGDEVINTVDTVDTTVFTSDGYIRDSPFMNKFRELYGSELGSDNGRVAAGYDAMTVLSDVIYTGGYSADAIVEGLADYRKIGVTGTISFDENHSRYPSFECMTAYYHEWRIEDIIEELAKGTGDDSDWADESRIRAAIIQANRAGDMETVEYLNDLLSNNEIYTDISDILEKYPVAEETLYNPLKY